MKPALDHWTIVIAGRWNVSIFNPDWLGKNLFDDKQLGVEFPLDPGLPMRFTGDNTLLLAHSDRVVFGAKEAKEADLTHMEALAVKLLGTLSHTPIIAVGMNFGYEVQPIPNEIADAFKNPHAQGFIDHQLLVASKSFKWGCKYDGQNVNVQLDFDDNKLLIKFNFHTDSRKTEEAIAAISGKVVQRRALCESVLEEIYHLKQEDL